MTNAFAVAAPDLAARRVAVLPVGGDDGKVPLIKHWNRWKEPPGLSAVAKLTEKHPNANIGIACGPSGVTVVDIDDVGLLSLMIERFGETPLKTVTPSGGIHLWYRNSGEGCTALRAEGLAVDIKGRGGFVVVPPSVRPAGQHAGRSYGFLVGDWNDLQRLPPIRPGALRTALGARPLRAVREGHRNNMLFSSLLRHAHACDSIEALYDVGETINADFVPPLESREVAKTIASAWAYEIEGRNWVGKEQRVWLRKSELEALAAHRNGGDGALLFLKLRMTHWCRDQFAVSAKAMTDTETIPAWGVKRYRAALGVLVEVQLLQQVYRGGRYPGDPSLFSFTSAATGKGARGEPNITRTPLSPVPGATGEIEARSPALVLVPVSPASPLPFFSPSPSSSGETALFGLDGRLTASGRIAVLDAWRRRAVRQDQLAELVGICRPTLSNILAGRFGASPQTASRIVEVIASTQALERQPFLPGLAA
jgi:bifunctional DNA primase/polymerase-like protein/primase-like protein